MSAKVGCVPIGERNEDLKAKNWNFSMWPFGMNVNQKSCLVSKTRS